MYIYDIGVYGGGAASLCLGRGTVYGLWRPKFQSPDIRECLWWPGEGSGSLL